ncbi:PqqD family peptide modification chaperone [Halobacteria archaeon AArc-m2/3/4]|uniref:PqqD family peptide modification chaperone n=1 Tax=Natronoglomus mannanivorans TaxID=2979990 RepID=A0AAP3E3D0_9EURY|nr:PqqD family peptide modification chaperone [Halobacteria archaeon AArc-xg1-1]MCU4974881.1 PqqD family peptide modification chaperone [Halobacteria archaeon AArc-m2/3/4]
MTNTFEDEAIVVADGDLLTTELDDEMVILDGDAGTYYGLNEVGCRIWELIQEPRTVADVRHRLVDEYDVDPERCTRDLHNVLEDLSSSELVEIDSD